MARGRPHLQPETGGWRDGTRKNENGRLRPIRAPGASAEAVRRLLRDAALRERLGRAARVDAETHYTWDKVALTVADAYERLAAARPT